MTDMERRAADYRRVEAAIMYIESRGAGQPDLAEIAAHVGLSDFHFQKLFGRWVGITPKRFLQYLTKEHVKRLLETSRSLLDVTFDAGLSSPARLHELIVTCEAMTPGEYRSRGWGLTISYGFHPGPFGEFLLATTDRGICGLKFVREGDRGALETYLRRQWPRAEIRHDQAATARVAGRIFNLGPRGSIDARDGVPLHLFVRGTNFQIKVWEALLTIPLGAVVSYEDLARRVGLPGGSRAVGNAVGANPLPFLIPCHRVIRKVGAFGNYGEGTARKKAILAWESAVGAAPTSGSRRGLAPPPG